MSDWYVKFKSTGEESLTRLQRYFELIKAMKERRNETCAAVLYDFLSEPEKFYFWDPSLNNPQDWKEFCMPNCTSRSPLNITVLPLKLKAMYRELLGGDYDLVSITEDGDAYRINCGAHGWPYGDPLGMVELAECFGHEVIGVDDGTGFSDYMHRRKYLLPSPRRGDH